MEKLTEAQNRYSCLPNEELSKNKTEVIYGSNDAAKQGWSFSDIEVLE
jgi:hypothetical protein